MAEHNRSAARSTVFSFKSPAIAVAGLGLLAVALATLVGCAAPVSRMDPVNAAYARGDYAGARQQAVAIARSATGIQRDQAAYVAGLSSYRLGDLKEARNWLTQASRSTDRKLAGDALAMLGVVYSELHEFGPAASALEQATRLLTGQDRANAHFYAGAAQQKLGHWTQARAHFDEALRHSSDADFRARVSRQMAITGFTIQLGAFSNTANAQRAAQQYSRNAASLGLAPPRVVRSSDDPGVSLVHLGAFRNYATAAAVRAQLGAQVEAVVVPMAGGVQ